MAGILDQKAPKKQDFSDVFMEDAKMKAEHMEKIKDAQKKERPIEDEINKLQNALNGKTDESKKIEAELKDMERYSDDDIKLAEELLFNGYAKKNSKINDKVNATFYTVSANEVSIVNELMYEFTKKYETSDGRVDVGAKTVDQMNQLYMLAVSFKGFNEKDVSDTKGRSLDLIKSAFKQIAVLEIEGDMEKYNALLKELKTAIKGRAAEIKRVSATILDVLSMKRYEFERVMYDIINRGDVLPKS